MRYELVHMTPFMAMDMLTGMPSHNRPLRPARVRALTKTILEGRWQTTHQGVAISADGVLLDGQHRLHAICEADKEVDIWVAYDADPETFSVIDVGSKRSGGDTLSMQGVTAANNTAAALRILHAYYQDPDQPWYGQNTSLGNDEVMDELAMRPEISDTLTDARRLASALGNTITAMMAAVYIIHDADQFDIHWDYWRRFVDGITSGEGLQSGDPRLVLRNYAMRQITSKRHPENKLAVAIVIKAWNAYRLNKHMSSIGHDMEKMTFPLPFGTQAEFGETKTAIGGRKQSYVVRHIRGGGKVLERPSN